LSSFCSPAVRAPKLGGSQATRHQAEAEIGPLKFLS
jgi:hypothetical protein